MIIVMKKDAPPAAVEGVIACIRAAGLTEHVSRGTECTLIGAIGDERGLAPEAFERLPGVERAFRVLRDYRFVASDAAGRRSVVNLRGALFGAVPQIVAGPGLVRRREDVARLCTAAAHAGATVLRCSLYEGRQPYGFGGLARAGLEVLRETARSLQRPFMCDVNDVRLLDMLMQQDVDAFDVPAAQMGNRPLLRELGAINKVVVLRRAPGASVEEWLMAAELVAAGGNHHIVLCEQGGGGVHLDVGALALARRETRLPVVADVSVAAAGHPWMVPALAMAAMAAGADGVLATVRDAGAGADEVAALDADGFAALVARLVPDQK